MDREIGEYVICPDPDNDRLPFILGEGTFGITYLAKHRVLGLPVALKVLKATAPAQGIIDSLAREARILRELRHPHIASFENVGISNGIIYCAMELCEFGDLESLASLRGPLGAGHLLAVASQTAAALEAAHTQGYIHRDIKPSNLMLARLRTGTIGVKLIDFGLSVWPCDHSPGGVAGSPVFVSPEQLSMGSVDLRSDLYALGVTLWYLACGRRPSQLDGNTQAVFDAHLSAREFSCMEVPPLLKPLVLKLVRKNPAERYQNAPELAAALRELAVHFQETSGELDLSLVATPMRGAPQGLDDFVAVDPKPLEQTFLLGTRAGRDVGAGTLYRATTLPAPGLTVGLTVVHCGDRLKGPSLLDLRRQVTRHSILAAEIGYPSVFIRPQQLHVFQDDRVAIASDWVDGPPFEDILRMRRRFRFDQLLPMLLQLGAGIDFCHSRRLPIPDLSERGMTVVSAVSWSTDGDQDGVQSELQIRLSPLRIPSSGDSAEVGAPESTVMHTLVDAGDQVGEPSENPTAIFTAKIYRYVSGAPVPPMAFTLPDAYMAIPGLGSESNRILAGFIAQRQPAIAGCLGVLEAICAAEGIPLPPTGKASSSGSAEFPPAKPKESSRAPSPRKVADKTDLDQPSESPRRRGSRNFLLPIGIVLLCAGVVIGMGQIGLLRRLLSSIGHSEKPTTVAAGSAVESHEPLPKTTPSVPDLLESAPPSLGLAPEIVSSPEPTPSHEVVLSGENRLRPRLVPLETLATPAQVPAFPHNQSSPKDGEGNSTPTDKTWEAGRQGWIFQFEEGRWVTVSSVLSQDSASKRRSLCRLLSDADQQRGVIYQGWVYQPLPDGRVVLTRAVHADPSPLTQAQKTKTSRVPPAQSTEIFLISQATQIPLRLPIDRSMAFTELDLLQLLEIRYPRENTNQRQEGEDLVLRFPAGQELRLSGWFRLLQRE